MGEEGFAQDLVREESIIRHQGDERRREWGAEWKDESPEDPHKGTVEKTVQKNRRTGER